MLNIFDFDAFCCTCGGFYASFQQLVDPGKVVYIMGTLSSEGLSSSATRLYTPRILESLSGLNVSQLSCGGQHVAILTENGTVYTFGHGKYGRLGHGNEDVRTVPTRVHLLETTCVQVACGFAYTTAVTETGELYSWVRCIPLCVCMLTLINCTCRVQEKTGEWERAMNKIGKIG